ncbi:MAG: 2-oxoacid:acceptor oxidoreductase family protein [Desulfomonile tiedjei]|nr:2-oxoacid:acceptor oxidoreductase family protein [Desulfomonile tiedjei]
MSRTEIMVGGVGGQGVVLSGILLGTAATLFENKKAVQTQSYSSELRGGSARAEVIISEKPISDPQVRRPDIFIALAEEALPRHIGRVKPGGLVIVDSDRVTGLQPGNYEVIRVPASSIAEKEMGDLIVANLVILGALIKRHPIVSAQALEKAIEATVPQKAKALNIAAFRRGLEMNV